MAKMINEKMFHYKNIPCVIKTCGYSDEEYAKIIEVMGSISIQQYWLCGYVVIENNSQLEKYFGIEYSNDIYNFVDVHGGLTYSQREKDKGWVIGFDCNHYGDSFLREDYEYVKREIIGLVNQLLNKEKGE